MAVLCRKPKTKMLIQSDQGCQFTSRDRTVRPRGYSGCARSLRLHSLVPPRLGWKRRSARYKTIEMRHASRIQRRFLFDEAGWDHCPVRPKLNGKAGSHGRASFENLGDVRLQEIGSDLSGLSGHD